MCHKDIMILVLKIELAFSHVRQQYVFVIV